VKVDICPELHGERRAAAWALYSTAFDELDALAIQRHLMTREEFAAVADDSRILKYCAITDDGTLVGLATYTNDLAAWPLISPAYFKRRWPDLYAARRIWYCGFVAVHPEHAGTGAYQAMVEELYHTAEAEGGVIGLDVCRFNDEGRNISRSIGLLLHRVSGGKVRPERADTQSFWIYETDPAAPVTA
jgi:GNAT superfamily N-acetyltransferase